MSEFHKEFSMRTVSLSLSLVLVSCGIISLPLPQHTHLHLSNPEYYMYCPITLHEYDVIRSCNGRVK